MSGENRNLRLQIIVAFAILYVLWGSTYAAIRIVVEHVPSVVMAGVRFTLAGAAMLAWCAWRGKRVRLQGGELLRLTVIGTLMLGFGNILLGVAEQWISSGLAALLGAVTPLWFLLIERLYRRGDRISVRGMAGILLGLLGVAVLMWPSLRMGLHLGHRELVGAGLVLISGCLWACGSMLAKHWPVDVDVYAASGWQMMMAGLVDLAGAILSGRMWMGHWTWEAGWAIVYLIIAGSWLGYTAFIWLLHHVRTSLLSTHAYVNPIVAVFLGWLILDERITGYIVAGSIIVVVSVILVSGARRQEAAPAEDQATAAFERRLMAPVDRGAPAPAPAGERGCL